MKFSIIYEAQMVDISRANEAQVFHDMVEQCLLAEEMGFDCIWAVEHHCLTRYAHMSAPETFLAFIAGATKRIHVGHGVVCLPPAMNHPVKVAERIATLERTVASDRATIAQVAVVAEQVRAIKESVERIETKLDHSSR